MRAEKSKLFVNQTDLEFLDDGELRINLDVSGFSDENGKVLRFAVWVREEHREIDNQLKPPITFKSWSAGDKEWIALWVDAPKEKSEVSVPYHRRGRREDLLDALNNTYSISDDFIEDRKDRLELIVIGDNKEYWHKQTGYRNVKLKPGRYYRISVTGVNSVGSSNLYYSNPIKTMDKNTPGYYAAIVVPVLFVFFLACGAVFYFYKRRDEFIEQNKAQIRGPYDAPQLVSSGVENHGFKMDRVDKKSKVIQLADFMETYHELKQDSCYKFADEFFELKEVGRDQLSEASLIPANRGKNRYTNILAYDKTRVLLNAVDDEPGSDYVNANYIAGNNSPREFIASQGPLPGTKEDFWRMVWEQNSHIIVALCQVVERGRIKCDHYWPYDNESEWIGTDLNLQMTRESTLPEWIEREFVLIKGEERKEIKQFHFIVWPDNGVPNPLDPLVRFVRQVRHEMNRFPTSGPTVIHCSAGVGRTGTFVGIDRLLQDHKKKSYVDIFGMVYDMRMSRCLMVQTEAQYICLHDLVYQLQTGKMFFANETMEDSPIEEKPPLNDTMNGYANEALCDSTSSSSSSSLTTDEEPQP